MDKTKPKTKLKLKTEMNQATSAAICVGMIVSIGAIVGTIIYIAVMLTSCSSASRVVPDVDNLEAGIEQFLSTSTADPADTALIGREVSDMRDLGNQTYEEMVYVGSITYIFTDTSYQMTELVKLFAKAEPTDTNWTGAVELRFGLLRIDLNAVYAQGDLVPIRLRDVHLEYANACADYERFMNLASSGLQDMNQSDMIDALEFLTSAGEHIQAANLALDEYNNVIGGD